MLSPCRSPSEPCQCARCRYGRQMSNRPMMPCPNGSKNYRRPPCCGYPPEVAQDIPPAYAQEYPGQLPQVCGYQDLRNYGQPLLRNDFQPCPWNGGQQSPSLQPYPGNGGQPFSGIPNQQLWQDYGLQTSPQNSPGNISPGSNNENGCNCSDCPGSRRRRKKRNYRRPRKCCSCEFVVTHEMGVQTEDEPEPPATPPAPIIQVIDVTTQEKEVRHRTGEVEIVVDEIQSVRNVPNDGSQPTQEYVQGRVVSSKTNATNEESQKPQSRFEEEIKPIYVNVPSEPISVYDLQPILEQLRSTLPSGYSTPTEHKDRLVYRTNTTYERDYENPSERTVTRTITEDKPAAASSQSREQSPPAQSHPSRSPPSQAPPSQSPPSQSPPSQSPPSQWPPSQWPPSQSPQSLSTQSRSPQSRSPPSQSPPSRSPLSRSPPSRSSQSRSPPKPPVATVRLNKRWPSGKDVVVPKPKKMIHLNAASSKTPPQRKFVPKGPTSTKKKMEQDSEEQMVINRNVAKPRASDFDNVSTVHMKVVNRQETVSKRPNRDSIKKMAVYETRISELRVMEPTEEEEEEEEEETEKPTPEPEPEPKPKKPKRKRLPKKEIKYGYPSNDLVCRMHRPPRKQLCPPPCRRAVCRGYSFPCFGPCASGLCSSRPPSCPRQCDPIYGFGSIPVAYYCH